MEPLVQKQLRQMPRRRPKPTLRWIIRSSSPRTPFILPSH